MSDAHANVPPEAIAKMTIARLESDYPSPFRSFVDRDVALVLAKEVVRLSAIVEAFGTPVDGACPVCGRR